MVKAQFNQSLHLAHTSEGPLAQIYLFNFTSEFPISANFLSRALSLEDDCICIRLNKSVSLLIHSYTRFEGFVLPRSSFLRSCLAPEAHSEAAVLDKLPFGQNTREPDLELSSQIIS